MYKEKKPYVRVGDVRVNDDSTLADWIGVPGGIPLLDVYGQLDEDILPKLGTGLSYFRGDNNIDGKSLTIGIKLGTGLDFDEDGKIYSDGSIGTRYSFGSGFYVTPTFNDEEKVDLLLGTNAGLRFNENFIVVDDEYFDARYEKLGVSACNTRYVSSTTLRGSVTKVDVPGFVLSTSARLIIRMTDGAPEVSEPKLNVGETGDKFVYYNGGLSGYGENLWSARELVEAFYDGVYWQLFPMVRK